MRTALLVLLSVPLLALPTLANPAQTKALEAIKTALKEFPLGTPFEVINKRKGFKYHKDLDMTVGNIDGVAILASFEDNKLSHLSINDLKHYHRGLIAVLKRDYGSPESKKEPAQTSYRFKKEGKDTVILKFMTGSITSIEIGTPKDVGPID